jgi:hypothetical protein
VRRSAHSQQIRLSDQLIGQAERELEREQVATQRRRGLLDRLGAGRAV